MRGVSNAAPIRYVLSCIALDAVLGLGGCALPERRPAVPLEMQEQASVAGLPGIRYIVGGDMSEFILEGIDFAKREKALLAGAGHATTPISWPWPAAGTMGPRAGSPSAVASDPLPWRART